MKYLYILSPRGVSDAETEETVRAIRHTFAMSDKDTVMVHISRFPRDGMGFIPEFAKSLPKGEKLHVRCIGGDGMLFDCLGGIMNARLSEARLRDIELSCHPCGRTNSFMANFAGSDRNPWDIPKGTPRKIDVIDCGSNYAMNFIQIGLGGYVKHASRGLRGYIPQTAEKSSVMTEFIYDIIAASAILRGRVTTQNYIVNIDGEDLTGTYAQVHVAGGAYCSDHFKMSPDADVSDGLLDLILVRTAPVRKLLPAIVKYYMRGKIGEYAKLAEKGGVPDLFVRRRGKHVTVSSDRIMYSDIDGESFTSYHIDMNVIPGKLNFVV